MSGGTLGAGSRRWVRILSGVFSLLTSLSAGAGETDPAGELRGILDANLKQTSTLNERALPSGLNENGGVWKSKQEALLQMDSGFRTCSQDPGMQILKREAGPLATFGYACRAPGGGILSSEVFVSKEPGQKRVIFYREAAYEEHEVPPSLMMNLLGSGEFEHFDQRESLSPGLVALLALVKAGVPLALTFKAANVLTPYREDWQMHFIMGSFISGLTVLLGDVYLRERGKEKHWKLNDLEYNVLSALMGLLAGIAAGTTKELLDKYAHMGTPEFRDALYTAEGAAMVAISFSIPLEGLFQGRKRKN